MEPINSQLTGPIRKKTAPEAEVIDIAVEAHLDVFSVAICTQERLITDVKVKGIEPRFMSLNDVIFALWYIIYWYSVCTSWKHRKCSYLIYLGRRFLKHCYMYTFCKCGRYFSRHFKGKANDFVY